MKAIFRHELGAAFKSLTGYVFGAFLLLFAGLYTMAYNLRGGLVNFEYVFGSMSFVYLLIVPVLTMRTLAEERRQRTDQLLYSLPLTMTRVVLGKYFALLGTLLLPTAILCLYPLLLRPYGAVHFLPILGAALGFVLLGAALLAIGVFLSSVTESQAVAAGLCFAVMLLNYFLNSLAAYVPSAAYVSLLAFSALVALLALVVRQMTKNTYFALMLGGALEAALLFLYAFRRGDFTDLFPALLRALSLYERFYAMVDGVFDLRSVVYFLTVIAVFLFLSVQSMEKRRWSE